VVEDQIRNSLYKTQLHSCKAPIHEQTYFKKQLPQEEEEEEEESPAEQESEQESCEESEQSISSQSESLDHSEG